MSLKSVTLLILIAINSSYQQSNEINTTTMSVESSSNENQLDYRIVGGHPVLDRSAFPYIVSLKYLNYHICGASIINEKYVVTAAHCCVDSESGKTQNPMYFSLLAGTLRMNLNRNDYLTNPYLQERLVQNIIVHYKYSNKKSYKNDIALISVNRKWKWNKFVLPIPLAHRKFVRDECFVSGWGVTIYNESASLSNKLLVTNVPLLDDDTCSYEYRNLFVPEKMVCAGIRGKDSCQGDSGGPLECNHQLVGIVSWGFECAKSPGVYTSVYHYRHWIYEYSAAKHTKINYSILIFSVLLINLLKM